jgi:hypothetical protein
MGNLKFVMDAIESAKSFGWLLCLTLSACQPNSPETAPSPINTATNPSPRSEVTGLPTPASASPFIVASPKQTSTPQPSAVAKSPAPNPIFRPIFPALKYQTQIPILLPEYVPESEQPNQVYAILKQATRSNYQILLAFTEDCQGGTACRLGEISGKTINPQTPTLKGQAVLLNESIKGYFVESKCGANCLDATLTWEQAKHHYTVAIKAGRKATLVKMANSAIANRPL